MISFLERMEELWQRQSVPQRLSAPEDIEDGELGDEGDDQQQVR